jgi:hypothetical protein
MNGCINQTSNGNLSSVEAMGGGDNSAPGRVDAAQPIKVGRKKMFRSWYAIGISTGLSLVPLQSATAQQQESRHHHARASVHEREAVHQQAVAKKQLEKDAKALTALKNEIRDLRQQVVAVESLRHELTDLKEKIWGPTPLPLTLAVLPRPQSAAVVEPKQVTLKLPDFSAPAKPQAPVNPASASLPAVIEERSGAMLRPRSAVEEAKAYLIDTATPGYTMIRQGVSVAIGRLHPEFVVKLAAAIRLAREEGMKQAGLFSAYRPPAFGIGGFRNKFNSLHSYGLAVDMTGIGGAGSQSAKLWQTIVGKVGLYLPYGPNNRKEFNHTQLVPTKMASATLRRTITAAEPKDLQQMWLASGISTYVNEVTAAKAPALASASAVAHVVLPAADIDQPGSSPQPAAPATAPRRSRARRPGKAGEARTSVATRSSGRKTGKTGKTTRKAATK